MEQPPGGLEDLQHQDVSPSIIPGVIDLTRKEGECLHSSLSLDALRRVKGSGWAPNSGATIHGLQFSETGSPDVTVRSGDQIQPDNALSHTTVTLSYVSRSHVFSTHNSPVYSVSPVRFSLQPHCNADNRGTGYALNHRYPEREEEAVNPVSRTEPFPSFSQPQLGPEDDAREYYVQEPPECNGGVPSADAYEEEPPGEEEKRSSLPQNGDRLENGQRGGSEPSPEVPRADEGGTYDVLLVETKKRDQVASDSGGGADLCSASREYKSPLEDPVSPPSTSVGDMEDVFLLPQASSSPSGDGFCPEAADDALSDTLSTGGAPRALGDCPARAESSDESKRLSHRRKAVLEPLTDFPDEPRVSGDPETRTGGAAPHINGNANVLERTIKERKLPMRSGRGTRLEAIVMNINSSRYRVSGCILANKKPSASQPPAHESAFLSSQRKKGRAKSTLSQRTVNRKAAKGNKGKPTDAQTHDDSTSLSGLHHSEKAGGSTPAKRPRCARQSRPPRSRPVKSKTKPSARPGARLPAHHNSKRKPQRLPVPGPSVEIKAPKTPPAPRSPQTSQGDVKSKSPGSKAPPAQNTKAPRAPRRRRKKPKRGQPSIFSPKEPEIKLKYASYKEEKKDLRSDSFSPFVRVKRQQPLPALCTIINYAEEGKAQPRKQQQAHSSRFISAAVPSTSCLRPGRPSKHSRLQRALVCCLCGRSANSVDLGDLHGPYYPEGYRPNTKAPADESGLKEDEDDSSDSDSSSSILKARRWACSLGAPLTQQGPLGSRRWASGRTGSPAAKRARPDGGLADAEDWYSPPVLPAEPCEYWLHEDCGVWSAGVFLVKGKVYGLEEAVKVAQQTMCSACHNPGATLGCFFKGCPNKYHYRCALESDCVLVEENFSMKCRKHKNKTLKAPPGSRWHDR